MSRFLDTVFALTLLCAAGLAEAQAASKYPGIGRVATPKEIAAWDIDVRPDFKGLPPGSGTVAKGQDIWEAKCASCHGVFGESNEVFSPLIGGTTADDVKTGRVARLLDPSFPGRTTLMKVASLSTLWDYIHRAMPWTQPKSLTADEVYSVTAFLLNLGGVVPDDYTLSDKNMRETQARMPNRNGMTKTHAMWPGKEFSAKSAPDVKAAACMNNCVAEPRLASFLPDFARNAHGNLAEQNRAVGAQHGADTNRPEAKADTKGDVSPTASTAVAVAPAVAPTVPAAGKAAAAPAASGSDNKAAIALANKYSCTACHGMAQKIVGPGFSDVAKKYPGKVDYLVGKIKSGGTGIWGPVPMPPQTLSEVEAKTIATWIASGASK
jgi:S-disulfanyl-L-cysteine oxidoreductase SoxD